MANLPIPDETTWINYESQTGTGPLSFPFSVFAKADLRVKVGDTELAQSGFTFSGTLIDSGYDGGSVTLVTPAAAQDVLIWREVTPARSSDFAPASSVTIRAIDAALDRLTAHAQDARRDVDRGIKVAVGESGFTLPSADERAGRVVSFDDSGNLDTTTLDELIAAAAAGVEASANSSVIFNATLAEAISQRAVGTLFYSTDDDNTAGNEGEYRLYKRISVAPYYEDQGEATALLSQAAAAASGGSALVGFVQPGAGAQVRTVEDKARDFPTLLDFIPAAERAAIKAGTSTYDCTAAFTAAFAAHDAVKATAGLYNLSTVNLSAGKRLLTDGHATVFQQIAGQPLGTRMLCVTGSNVEIGSMTVRGNISTDTDEQNHAIFIQANATNGHINNVRIGDVHGEDIRGDVVYFGQASGALYKLTNVTIGNITFDNVYRNGVSCVSADGFTVESVSGTRCGYTHMDVEANLTSGPCVNGRIGFIKGRCFGLVSPGASDYIDNIEIGVLDLSPDHAAQSSPSYAPGVAITDGFMVRNVRRARVGKFKASGYNRCAIFITYNGGELGCEDLEIGSAYLRSCSLTDAVYNSYIQWNSLTTNKLRIGHLDAVISGANKRVIDNMRSGYIGSVLADAQSGAMLLRTCNDVQIGSVVQAGAGGFLLQSCNRVSVKGGSFTGDRLATSSSKCSFENLTATAAAFLFTSGQEDHFVANCTLNGDYYGFGTAIKSHLFPMRLGGFYLWADAQNRLRRKTTAPTSDTDGAVIAAVAARGVTGSRPTLTASDIGVLYMDTTLDADGKPIWWTGAVWVDATGATV